LARSARRASARRSAAPISKRSARRQPLLFRRKTQLQLQADPADHLAGIVAYRDGRTIAFLAQLARPAEQLMPTLTDRGIIWRFAGVIVEAAAGGLFEQIVAVRDVFIQPNGHIG
jgi:hypothetical protein